MKKNYLIILLVAIITSSALFPGNVHSQDLTDEQRKERCQNNKNRLVELETELKTINAQLSSTMTQDEMGDARSHMALVTEAKKHRALYRDGLTNYKKELVRIAGRYNFNFDKCVTEEPYLSTAEIQCLTKFENIIASKIDKAKALNKPKIQAKKNEIEEKLAYHRNNLIFFRCDQFSAAGGNTGSACFASDTAMGSTNRDDHYNWAQGQDGSQLQANTKSKINILYNCPSVTHDAFAAAFADISVIISQYAQEINSLNNDAGARNPDSSAHYNWAKNQSREQVLQNLQWKMKETFENLDSREVKIFFADVSVPIARANQTSSSNSDNSGGGVGEEVNWNGTFGDSYSRATLRGSGNSVSCSWTYNVSGAKGTASWSNCKVVGNTVTGNWTAQHEDDTKTGTRKGTFTATLSDNTLSGQFLEDTPAWSYKTGYNKDNVQSSMRKGAVWPFSWKRQ